MAAFNEAYNFASKSSGFRLCSRLGKPAALTGGIVSGVVGIIGLIEGIIYLTKDDETFYQTYVANKKPWF